MEQNNTVNQCPEFPYFGAWYPDATCIDGTLQDLDNCDSDGNIFLSSDTPCPFCNSEAFLEHEVGDKEDFDTAEEYEAEIEKVKRWMQSVKERYA